MDDIQILKESLTGRGILEIEDFNRRKKNVRESLKPRNFLTVTELHEAEEALRNLKLPKPTGWAHALSIYSSKNSRDSFSPDRSYCGCCLTNLRATLREAGLKSDNIFKKLATAIRTAERYRVERCQFLDE